MSAIRKIIWYIHRWGMNSRNVAVFEDHKGTHRDHCLCHSCDKLKLDSGRENNCPVANELYLLCIKHDITTPVFECPCFEPLPKDIAFCVKCHKPFPESVMLEWVGHDSAITPSKFQCPDCAKKA